MSENECKLHGNVNTIRECPWCLMDKASDKIERLIAERDQFARSHREMKDERNEYRKELAEARGEIARLTVELANHMET